MVYCLRGISFIRLVAASDVVKDATTLCNLFVELVECISPKNLLHLFNNNATNYKPTRRLLNGKYLNVYLSPCVALWKQKIVVELAKRASLITKFVYNHKFLLAWLRKRKGWARIIRLVWHNSPQFSLHWRVFSSTNMIFKSW